MQSFFDLCSIIKLSHGLPDEGLVKSVSNEIETYALEGELHETNEKSSSLGIVFALISWLGCLSAK